MKNKASYLNSDVSFASCSRGDVPGIPKDGTTAGSSSSKTAANVKLHRVSFSDAIFHSFASRHIEALEVAAKLKLGPVGRPSETPFSFSASHFLPLFSSRASWT